MNEDIVVPIAGMLSVFVFFPLTIAYARYIWKRASAPPPTPAVESEAMMRRMAELQQSMDAIAVEVERIAEGQRFVTKLMAERPAVAELPASTKASSRKGA